MTSPIAEAALAPLLRTKLFPSHGERASWLMREALLQRLLDAAAQRLVIVSAPAGAGKSTALGQYRTRLQALGAQVAWLSCDEADSEPLRFLQYVVAALTSASDEVGLSAAHLLSAEGAHCQETVLQALVADLACVSSPLYLMLDDFHRIRHPALGVAARYLIEHLPCNVHVLVTTRYQPRFMDERPGLGDWALSLQADTLRLSLDETREYLCQVQGLELSESELKLLYERTEGWITALQLAALALPRQLDRAAFLAGLSGAERDIADYLTEDVVASLPEPLQLFLDQTSVLDEFNAELCNALTGRHDADAVIQRLRSEQLFIVALDEQGTWFRYHHLFAEFLQRRLAKRGDPAHYLHAAARWCESHKLADQSVKYALKARNYAFAAELLERQGAKLIAGNRVYGILAVLSDIPVTVIREHPVFQIFYAWQLAFEQKFAESEALIEEVSAVLTQGRGKGMAKGLLELLVASQVLKALVLLYQDKLEACLKVASQWLAMVPAGQTVFLASLGCVQAAAYALLGEYGEASKAIAAARSHLSDRDSEYLHAMASVIEALICKDYGDYSRGRDIAEAARARVVSCFGPHSRVGGPLALAYADVLYEQNLHGLVLGELPNATTWRDVATPVELISRGQLVMARAGFFSGDGAQGLAQLDQWLLGQQGVGLERVCALALSLKVHFLLWLRRPNEAQRVVAQLERLVCTLPAERYADVQVALAMSQARLALIEHRTDKALQVLEGAWQSHLREHQRDRYLRVSLLLSVALWRKGNSDKAFELLESTVTEAWQRGYRRAFLDDALWLLPLWDAWFAARPSCAAQWQDLACLMREQCLKMAVDPAEFEENQYVSLREREVLRLVAAGLSNRDIAQAVHLSEATIKWHLHNLFAKLAVRSRTQAVLKGKSLGLLSEA